MVILLGVCWESGAWQPASRLRNLISVWEYTKHISRHFLRDTLKLASIKYQNLKWSIQLLYHPPSNPTSRLDRKSPFPFITAISGKVFYKCLNISQTVAKGLSGAQSTTTSQLLVVALKCQSLMRNWVAVTWIFIYHSWLVLAGVEQLRMARGEMKCDSERCLWAMLELESLSHYLLYCIPWLCVSQRQQHPRNGSCFLCF